MAEPGTEHNSSEHDEHAPIAGPANRTRWVRFVIIGGGIVLALILISIGVLAWRADRALRTVQQQDPRRRTTTVATQVVESPSVTALPTALATTAAPTEATVAATAVPTAAALPSDLRRPFNVLLMGVDLRSDRPDDARTDTIILVHVDPIQRWVSMLSIPRDTVATIPGVGQRKINAAYSYGFLHAEQIYGAGTEQTAGGAALAAETVENYLGVSVDYTAQIDFHGFQEIVDAAGGVTVDVDRPLLDPSYPTENYGIERIYIPAGLQTMDGRTALIYARSRHSTNDFDRSRRQQKVLHALRDQVVSTGLLESPSFLAQVTTVLEQNVRTTLPLQDLGAIAGIANLAREIDTNQIVQLAINPQTTALDNEIGSDLYWNKRDVQRVVAAWEGGPEYASANPPRASYVPRPAATATPVEATPADATVEGLETPATDATVEGMSEATPQPDTSGESATPDPSLQTPAAPTPEIAPAEAPSPELATPVEATAAPVEAQPSPEPQAPVEAQPEATTVP